MSIHKSLKIKSALQRARNVYTRWERLERLKENGLWQEGESVFGLPKVKVLVAKRAGKKKKKKEEEAK